MTGNNVFVSYKYGDSDVKQLKKDTIVRDYVDELIRIFDKSREVRYRGEKDGNDLSELCDETRRQHLADLIFYTSVTIVLMSPGMYDRSKPEKDQWIPWEISYSMKENKREAGLSHTNAVLAVVLPDRNGSYAYAIEDHNCHRTIRRNQFFPIIRKNMFNIKRPDKITCECGCNAFRGTCSYIPIVKWEDFTKDYNKCIQQALENRDNSEKFNLFKTPE